MSKEYAATNGHERCAVVPGSRAQSTWQACVCMCMCVCVCVCAATEDDGVCSSKLFRGVQQHRGWRGGQRTVNNEQWTVVGETNWYRVGAEPYLWTINIRCIYGTREQTVWCVRVGAELYVCTINIGCIYGAREETNWYRVGAKPYVWNMNHKYRVHIWCKRGDRIWYKRADRMVCQGWCWTICMHHKYRVHIWCKRADQLVQGWC